MFSISLRRDPFFPCFFSGSLYFLIKTKKKKKSPSFRQTCCLPSPFSSPWCAFSHCSHCAGTYYVTNDRGTAGILSVHAKRAHPSTLLVPSPNDDAQNGPSTPPPMQPSPSFPPPCAIFNEDSPMQLKSLASFCYCMTNRAAFIPHGLSFFFFFFATRSKGDEEIHQGATG